MRDFTFLNHNTKKFLQIVEGELYTPPIYHYHARHCKLLTLLYQPKNIKSAFIQSKISSQQSRRQLLYIWGNSQPTISL